MNRLLSYYYVKNLAHIKQYNLQSISIRKFLLSLNQKQFMNDLNKNITEFSSIYPPFLARDLVFKNNSLVTRNNKLISPAHYFYYTNLIFDLVIDEKNGEKTHNYSTDRIEAFYSGMLFKNINDINDSRQTVFNYSYNIFQKKLMSFENKQAFVIDLQNFFDSIQIHQLLTILNAKYPNEKVDRLKQFFEAFNIETLPQFHYSIASSILSQEYLCGFDMELNDLLDEMDFYLIRFVDDMYFFNQGNDRQEKEIHDMLDQINKMLWKYQLNLNPNKIEMYIYTPFKREITSNSYSEFHFSNKTAIEDKAISLLEGDFIAFVTKVNNLFENDGYNIIEFSELFNEMFSIESEDAMKVLNNFIFSHKWKLLDDKEIEFILENYKFIFFLPDKLLTLYLMMYEYYERKYGRDEVTIREILSEIDKNHKSSLRYLYSSLHYLIQRNFKRNNFLKEINRTSPTLGTFIEKYIR